VELPTPGGVERVDVETALEMESQVNERASRADLVIMTAAVSDFRPASPTHDKLKKRMGRPDIDLELNPDILAGLATVAPDAIRVGFAAETRDLEVEGARKLQAKQVHFIVVNDVSRRDIGFASDENEVVVLAAREEPIHIPRQSKRRVARELLNLFVEALNEREARRITSDR